MYYRTITWTTAGRAALDCVLPARDEAHRLSLRR